MSASLFSKVAVAMQSALASALTVGAGGVTKANPGVVTYTGTDPSNGDFVLMTSSQGMTQLEGRIFRVANVNAGSNTFELEGEDTSTYDTMVSANVQVITFGTTFSTMLDLNVSGGEAASIDVTTIHDSINQEEIGNFSAITINSNLIWDPSDAAQVACKSASDTKAKRCFRLTFANGKKWLFYGAVGFTGAPTGAAQEVAKSPLTIKSNGRMTIYAS